MQLHLLWVPNRKGVFITLYLTTFQNYTTNYICQFCLDKFVVLPFLSIYESIIYLVNSLYYDIYFLGSFIKKGLFTVNLHVVKTLFDIKCVNLGSCTSQFEPRNNNHQGNSAIKMISNFLVIGTFTKFTKFKLTVNTATTTQPHCWRNYIFIDHRVPPSLIRHFYVFVLVLPKHTCVKRKTKLHIMIS